MVRVVRASCDVIILGGRREFATETRPPQVRAVDRWAVATMLLAMTLGFTAGFPLGQQNLYPMAHQLDGMLHCSGREFRSTMSKQVCNDYLGCAISPLRIAAIGRSRQLPRKAGAGPAPLEIVLTAVDPVKAIELFPNGSIDNAFYGSMRFNLP
jgi:hypothetical protein